MQYPAITLIKDEHAGLAKVLHGLRASVQRSHTGGHAPDFEAMRAMLFYMDEMPVRLHHANENNFLFPRIRERCPALRPVLDRLESEHEQGEAMVRDLEHALTAWQMMGDARREGFESLLGAFVDTYLGHMEVEENYVLTVAEDYLSAGDWDELNSAFVRQRGTMHEPGAPDHRALFERMRTLPISP